MTHLEQLIKEWFEFQGYFVRANLKVGKRERGGHAGELDIIAFHPVSKHLIHVEASIDPYNWEKRNNIFRGKFERGRRYFLEAFPWLDPDHKIEQWAVLWASDEKNKTIGDGMGKVVPIRKLYEWIAAYIMEEVGSVHKNPIPGEYPLLRTMQFTLQWA